MASLPDPIMMSEVTAWPSVFMDIGKAFEAIGKRHTFLRPLPMERKGDIAWEIGGEHSSGLYVCVRCHLEHGHHDPTRPLVISCSESRPHNMSLNTCLAQHLRDSKGECIQYPHWFVLLRTNPYAHGGIMKFNKKTEDRAKISEDLEEICQEIDKLFPTLLDNDDDDELDSRDVNQRSYKSYDAGDYEEQAENVDMIDAD